MKKEYLLRSSDLIPTEVLGKHVTVIGAGAIGSWTTLCLAKMGLSNITVYDDDTIEEENIGSQFYPPADIGLHKVTALAKLVTQFTEIEITAKTAKFDFSRSTRGILICAVDNMETRRKVWEWLTQGTLVELFIDPRMGAEAAALYVMQPTAPADLLAYPKTLYSDDQSVVEACTSKATIYCANLLSGLVVKSVKDWLSGNILKNRSDGTKRLSEEQATSRSGTALPSEQQRQQSVSAMSSDGFTTVIELITEPSKGIESEDCSSKLTTNSSESRSSSNTTQSIHTGTVPPPAAHSSPASCTTAYSSTKHYYPRLTTWDIRSNQLTSHLKEMT